MAAGNSAGFAVPASAAVRGGGWGAGHGRELERGDGALGVCMLTSLSLKISSGALPY